MATSLVIRKSLPRPIKDMPVIAHGLIQTSGEVMVVRATDSSTKVYSSPEALLRAHEDAVVTNKEGTQELILDPWHAEAFEGTPAEDVVLSTGPRKAVWASLDAWGQPLGIIGPAVPGPSMAEENA